MRWFMKAFITGTLLTVTLLGCKSDQTLERDEVKRKAIYQEYHLEYSIPEKKLESKVYFKTSTTGDYIRLSSSDSISMKYLNNAQSSPRAMKRSKTQIYLGSRNVPTYELSKRYELAPKSKVEWLWYDSETDKTISTEKKVLFPSVRITNRNNTVDTSKNDSINIHLSRKLRKNEILNVSLHISKNHTYRASFPNTHGRLGKNLKLDSNQLRKYFLTPGESTNREPLPRGVHPGLVKISIYSTEEVRNASKKDGTYFQTIHYYDTDLDVTF